MARRKGRKRWHGVSVDGWISLYGNGDIMTDLMMRIVDALYRSPSYTDNAKHIAESLNMEYRALNAAVGWAGNKIKALYDTQDDGGKGKRRAWEYVFDGAEDDDGIYLWILKDEAVVAYREWKGAMLSPEEGIEMLLHEDVSAFGAEGNLFSSSPEETVEKIRELLAENRGYRRKCLNGEGRCAVCGLERASLLMAVPYGVEENRQKGLLFCPTHGALFAARLISFSDRGKLLLSPTLSETDCQACGLSKGMNSKVPFSRRRMAIHRKYFHAESESKS